MTPTPPHSGERAEDVDGVPQAMIDAAIAGFHNCAGPYDWRIKEGLRVALAIPFDRRTIAERQQDAKDAARYRGLRRLVYRGEMPIGEAYLNFMVVGACPTTAEFDTAIDAAIAALDSEESK